MDSKFHFRLLFVLIIVLFAGCSEVNSPAREGIGVPVREEISLVYPDAVVDSSIVEEFHAVLVSDPYRPLERYNDNSGEWISQQQSIARQFFDRVPQRRNMEKDLERYWDYERFTLPVRRGNSHFYFLNGGLQPQDVLMEFADPFGKGKAVLDPNKFSPGQVLQDAKVSRDGRKVAYQISSNGSSWRTVKIRDLDTGKDLQEELIGVKHSCIAWHGDGFFYSRYDRRRVDGGFAVTDKFHQVFYHRLGTAQDEDEMVFADRHNPYTMLDVHTTSDEKFLTISVLNNTLGNELWYLDLSREDGELTLLTDQDVYEFELIDNIGENLLIKTNYGASNGRIVLVNSRNAAERFWEELIPETREVLQTAELVSNRIVACYLKETYSHVKIFEEDGSFVGELEMPEKGKVKCFEGERGENLAFFGFSTLTKPMSLYSVDVQEMTIEPYRTAKVAFDVEGYEMKQVWFDSYDRTEVSMYIVYRKGLKLDGQNPALMVVNGGLGQKLLPQFNPTGLHLLPYMLERDGIGVLVNVRGGKEMGRKWQIDGIRSRKQNAIDDLQAAAEYLIANNYTVADRLAVFGRENGGLIVGSCLIQRPDLFQVVVAEDGIFDMLRFEQFSIGWYWQQEFGNPRDGKSFDHLYAYSPMHNLARQNYPATMFMTGRENDMVVPLHSYKFMAGLQRQQEAGNPMLLSVHNGGYSGNVSEVKSKIKRSADILAFLEYNLQEQRAQ